MENVASDDMTYAGGWSRWPAGRRSILIGLSVFLLSVFLLLLRRPRNLPPGPRGWPILGCLPQMAWVALRHGQAPHVFFSKLAERYGDVVSFYLGGKLVVVVHRCATMRDAFGQQQLSGRPSFHVGTKQFPGRGVISASGAMWSELRRFSSTVLRGFGVGKLRFEENISTEADYLVEELKKKQGAPFDPTHPVNNAVSNVICTVVFGKRFQYGDSTFKDLLKASSAVTRNAGPGLVVEVMPAIFAKFPVFSFVRAYVNALSNFYTHIGLLIKEHEQVYDPEHPKDFIDEFLKTCEERRERGAVAAGLRPVNLLRSVGDMFLGGTETTATTLRWGLLYMMAFPGIQTRIQQELDAVTGRSRAPVISDRTNLPYTEAAICEILRISSILPLSVPHFCSETTRINGYNIPKGAFVIANLWQSHFDPSVWAEPKEFRPERFLDEDGKLCQREELIPFGNGRRVCLGENLAKMELFIFFTRLLHHFTFKQPEGAPPISFQGNLGVTWAPMDYAVCAIERA